MEAPMTDLSNEHTAQIQQTLQQHFGFDSLRLGQESVINTILEGHSSAAIFPTGSGKSLCYQLSALMLPNLTLVISPLLALMKDQLDFLHSKGIAAASIDSSQTREETQAVMQAVRSGQTKILMISVERLKNERFRQFISQVPISLLVVDEAHCISEWGHNFRPDYLKLPLYQTMLNIPQVLLLTATATQQVIEDMQSKFDLNSEHIIVTGFYRSNLDLQITPCEDEQKIPLLTRIINQAAQRPTIVYVTLQQTAEYVAKALQNAGINAAAYHAGLKTDQRQTLQQQFMSDGIDCIVATIAFGMGVDKSNIRRVIHYDLPKSIENYSQEIGRAGRDGEPSECILIANRSGLHTLENFVFGDTPDKASIEYVVEQIAQVNQKSEVTSHRHPQWEIMLLRLAKESNIRQLPLKTLLVYLEMEGIIEPVYSYFAEYRFKFLLPAAQIISKFHGERQSFVQTIFNCSPKARTWCQLNFDALYAEGNLDRKRVITAMEYFHEQGWIELESKQITDVYAVKAQTIEAEQLSHTLYQLFKAKEQNEVNRIENMLAFFQSTQCLSSELAGYFADRKAPKTCGHCSVCRGESATLPNTKDNTLDHHEIEHWISPLLTASNRSLSPEAITRFLCGIATPLTTQLKATKMEGYGKLETSPFLSVLSEVIKIRS